MKINPLPLLVFPLVFLVPAIASAQATVYQCQDQSGPVFSDTPCPGGKVMDLPPPNVIDTPKPTGQPAVIQPAAPAYTTFSILQPEDQGTVHSNTGEFPVGLSLTPALQVGNAITVSLDGTQLATLRTSLQFVITANEWGSAATDAPTHTLTATVVDQSGNRLIAATPVQFYARHATVHRK